jgi:hypothetical protein
MVERTGLGKNIGFDDETGVPAGHKIGTSPQTLHMVCNEHARVTPRQYCFSSPLFSLTLLKQQFRAVQAQ